jgi:hypothetical protein
MFCGLKNKFSDLLIELYQDGSAKKEPTLIMKSHKLVVSSHSGYILKMLDSHEGENTIRLTTAYPKSLEKLLLSFYDHVLNIESVEELIEMLYLADEYDLAKVMERLKELFRDSSKEPSFEITTTNAGLFLMCSVKLNLKLEKKIFAGLAEKWADFGPSSDVDKDYNRHSDRCTLLLTSLKFEEKD